MDFKELWGREKGCRGKGPLPRPLPSLLPHSSADPPILPGGALLLLLNQVNPCQQFELTCWESGRFVLAGYLTSCHLGFINVVFTYFIQLNRMQTINCLLCMIGQNNHLLRTQILTTH